ncbi:hypothetical protein [Acinetobacter baumannii]|uniref:hypothetical protein n=1 Tax=Acinetobacter baumannii TaxID=470 RepID=UPI0009A1C708|nr:hypothetical protein [Acinetobacter baumannii]
MEKQFADEKMKKYLRLMRLRRNFVLSVFLVPSVVIVVLMLARVDEKYLSIYFPIVMIPIILFLMFKLLANGICPWCKCGFFMNDGEFKHEVRQFEKSYDNQQAEQISLMV